MTFRFSPFCSYFFVKRGRYRQGPTLNDPRTVPADALSGRLRLSAIFALLWALTTPIAMLSQTVPAGTAVMETFHSKALDGNLVGDSADRGFTIYLPPTYQKGESRYPVIYLLHGALDTYKAWTEDPE